MLGSLLRTSTGGDKKSGKRSLTIRKMRSGISDSLVAQPVITLKIERIDEQLKPHERRPRKSKPSGRTITQVATSGPPSAFFTAAMLAERWYCSNSRLQKWRRDGKGPSYVKIEGRILYPYDELVKYEIQRLVKTESDSEE
jgi:hypothetical protein